MVSLYSILYPIYLRIAKDDNHCNKNALVSIFVDLAITHIGSNIKALLYARYYLLIHFQLDILICMKFVLLVCGFAGLRSIDSHTNWTLEYATFSFVVFIDVNDFGKHYTSCFVISFLIAVRFQPNQTSCAERSDYSNWFSFTKLN